jgi:hypothetical protein
MLVTVVAVGIGLVFVVCWLSENGGRRDCVGRWGEAGELIF